MMAAKAAEGRPEGKPPIKGNTPQICGVNDKGNSPAKASDAAKAMGISTRSVESAIKVRRDAAEEVADAVDSGEITLNAASQLAKSVPDKEEQKKAVFLIEGRTSLNTQCFSLRAAGNLLPKIRA